MNDLDRQLLRAKRVGVIGGNSPDAAALQAAEELGRLIAVERYILISGGMRGVMEASARGARAAGGLVLGILPGKMTSEANPFVDVSIATGLGYLRNALVVLNADVLVAVDGNYGTLSEISYAQIFGKTVFGLNTWAVDAVTPVSSPQEAVERIRRFFAASRSS